MNPLTPRALLACTIATVMLVAACASPSSNMEGTPVSVEQTKQALSGEWVSLAPEIRPSATKNPDGSLRPFYLTRRFKCLGDDQFELTITNSAERNLFVKLCISAPGLARMRSYEEKKITAPSRGFEVKGA